MNKKKTALITGGTHGIGLAIAENLAKSGMDIIVCSRTRERVNQTIDILKEYDVEVSGYTFDAISLEETDWVIEEIFCKKNIDVLVNNVGGGGRWGKESILDTDFTVWQEVYNKNMNVAIKFMLASLPHMVASGWGRIITISSIYGRQAGGCPWFGVAKAAQIALMKGMSVKKEFAGKGITFNTIIPGAIYIKDTGWEDMKRKDPEGFEKLLAESYPMGRMGKTEEVAGIVGYLCSEEASYINGACISVDGGESVSI